MSPTLVLVILVAFATVSTSAPLAQIERLLDDLLTLKDMKATLIEKRVVTTEENIETLKQLIIAKGNTGTKGLSRIFRSWDDDGSKALSFSEFKKNLRDIGVFVSEEDATKMFVHFDRSGNGAIDIDEFLIALMPPLSAARLEVLDQAFRSLDTTGDGVFTIADLQNQGETEEQALSYVNKFNPPDAQDGKVTKEDFVKYYEPLSALTDDDFYFVLMIKTAYGLP